MGVPVRPPILPKAALYLGITAGVLIAAGVLVGVFGALVAVLWRPAGLVASGVGLVALAVAPVLAIAAIVVGHISSHSHPDARSGRTGLIIGYCIIGLVALLAVVGWVTWQSIR